jgi:hypothetical protein
MAAEKTKHKKYMVYARSQDTMKERFVKVNAGGMIARPIPFEKPVFLTEDEVHVIRRIKEPMQIEKRIDVQDLMQAHQISQSKAQEMAKLMESDPAARRKFSWVAKYIVTAA